MSLFACSKCNAVENTALGYYWGAQLDKQPPLCSECHTGTWHGEFDKTIFQGDDDPKYAVGTDGFLYSHKELEPGGYFYRYSKAYKADENAKLRETPLTLVRWPDPRLTERCEDVTVIDDDLRVIVDRMRLTLTLEQGVALAANQVGVMKRIVVMRPLKEFAVHKWLVLINPTYVPIGEVTQEKVDEGCLSFPGAFTRVKRHKKIKVTALSLDGVTNEFEVDGFVSVAFQHEIDHLDGKTFLDTLSKFKRDRLLDKVRKYKKKHPSITQSWKVENVRPTPEPESTENSADEKADAG